MFPGFLMDIPDMPENISSLPPDFMYIHPSLKFGFWDTVSLPYKDTREITNTDQSPDTPNILKIKFLCYLFCAQKFFSHNSSNPIILFIHSLMIAFLNAQPPQERSLNRLCSYSLKSHLNLLEHTVHIAFSVACLAVRFCILLH